LYIIAKSFTAALAPGFKRNPAVFSAATFAFGFDPNAACDLKTHPGFLNQALAWGLKVAPGTSARHLLVKRFHTPLPKSGIPVLVP